MLQPMPVPAGPFSCPRCQAPAQPAAGVQACGMCRAAFVLRAGARADNTVIPRRSIRAAEDQDAVGGLPRDGVERRGARGRAARHARSVTGYIPIDEAGVLYSDIFSVAVWRTLDVVRLVLMIIISLPIVIGLLAAVVALPGC